MVNLSNKRRDWERVPITDEAINTVQDLNVVVFLVYSTHRSYLGAADCAVRRIDF